MAHINKTVESPVENKHNEVIVQGIAGPETAARLGIPVGSVFEARHVVMDSVTGEQLTAVGEDIVSPDEAAKLIGG